MSIRPIAFVTGANRGIGLAIATRLAAGGFDIVGTGLEPTGDEMIAAVRAAGGHAAYLPGDLADLATHERWLEAVGQGAGRIDCLVNNAGMGAVARGDVLDLTPANFDRVMGVNLRGTVFLTQAVARRMLAGVAAHPRSIITITSVSASHVSVERLDYCVSKAALAMWSKGLAVRLAAEGIGVFDVRPGIIHSDMTAAVTAKYDALIAGGLVPAGRWGEGADVAEAVAALASGRLGFATGSVLQIGGGLHIERL